ncbi:MAG: hypothetical protein ACLFSY_09565 [Desulfonatronovibrionaceae bacterium]
MNPRFCAWFVAVVAVVFLTACIVEEPIQNVDKDPIPTKSGDNLTTEDVAEAVRSGCVDKGWSPEDEAPGHIVATLHHGKLMAKVDISYDNNSYSIKYKDSRNLRHSGNVIHKRYNGWIRHLDQAIMERMRAKINQ